MNKNDVEIWYKVLDENCCACNGGDKDYSKYIKNGKWLPKIKNPVICRKGYHVTPFWNMWYKKGYRVFIVKPRDVVDIDEVGVVDKFVCGSFRFIEEVDLVFDYENNTGNGNTGDRNTGYWNTGNRNTGDRNTGDRNTGNWNTGDRNTGDSNTGHCNTGDGNTGNWNTGNWNTGNRNTGDWNTGYSNTGDWNTGDCNTGFLNTDTPPLRIFNKKTNIKQEDIDFPDFFFFEILADDKNLYKSWLKSFKTATKKDIEKLLNLPNFDYVIFEEITGITKKMIQSKLKIQGEIR